MSQTPKPTKRARMLEAMFTEEPQAKKVYSLYLQGVDLETISFAVGWQGDINRVDDVIDWQNQLKNV